MKTVEAWNVSAGQTLRYKSWGKKMEGIVLKVRSAPKDRVFITLTSGGLECSCSTIFELVEVK